METAGFPKTGDVHVARKTYNLLIDEPSTAFNPRRRCFCALSRRMQGRIFRNFPAAKEIKNFQKNFKKSTATIGWVDPGALDRSRSRGVRKNL
jgi:hypothetical protein